MDARQHSRTLSGSSESGTPPGPRHRQGPQGGGPRAQGCPWQARAGAQRPLHVSSGARERRRGLQAAPQAEQLAPGLEDVCLAAIDTTEFVAETLLPTRMGKYRLRGYRHTLDGGLSYTEPSCILTGEPEGQEEVPVRVHDACFTSEVLESLKCDCAEQLRLARRYIMEHPPGIIIYLQQEGRGIGLANKIAAYRLQERGMDTVDANRALGLPDDCREYTSVRNILADLRVRSIRLMTNNPRKIRILEELGVRVTERLPCLVPAQAFSEGYLATKQRRMSHYMNGVPQPLAALGFQPGLEGVEEEGELDGSYCHWNHDGELLTPSAAVGAGGAPPGGCGGPGSAGGRAGGGEGEGLQQQRREEVDQGEGSSRTKG